jgi:hypothetical protein
LHDPPELEPEPPELEAPELEPLELEPEPPELDFPELEPEPPDEDPPPDPSVHVPAHVPFTSAAVNPPSE